MNTRRLFSPHEASSHLGTRHESDRRGQRVDRPVSGLHGHGLDELRGVGQRQQRRHGPPRRRAPSLVPLDERGAQGRGRVILKSCSPRHVKTFESTNEGVNCVVENVARSVYDMPHRRSIPPRAPGGCPQRRRPGPASAAGPAAPRPRPPTRGLHSFPIQLNLSCSIDRMTRISSWTCPGVAQVEL